MSLDFPLTTRAIDLMVAENQPDTRTVFANPMSMLTPVNSQIIDYYTLPVTDGNNPISMTPSQEVSTVIDYYSPAQPENGLPGWLQNHNSSDIPTLADLKTTDRTPPEYQVDYIQRRNTTSVQDLLDKTRDYNPPPVDATILNNPAVENLQNFMTQPGSPLGFNFAGQSIVASGQDPAAFYNGQPQDLSQQEDVAQRPSDCAWYDFPCKFQTIKGEVTILIVGVLLLVVGIYAMTR